MIDPITFADQAPTAFQAFRWAKGIYKDHTEMSSLLAESCTAAVAAAADRELDDAAVGRVVTALAVALSEVKFPEPSPRLIDRVPGAKRIRRRPRERLVNERDPVELLRDWIADALKKEHVADALADVRRDPPVSAEAVAAQFPDSFRFALVRDLPLISDFRAQLLSALSRRNNDMAYAHSLQFRTGVALSTAALAGGVVGEAVDLTAFHSPASAAIGIGVFLVGGGLAEVAARARTRWTAPSVVHQAVLGFAGEVMKPDDPLPPLPDVLFRALESLGDDSSDPGLLDEPPGEDVIDELRARLIPDAEKAGEDEIAIVLTLLDDRLRRWARHPKLKLVRAETVDALLDLVSIIASPPAIAEAKPRTNEMREAPETPAVFGS
jgi:hypothetical protein